MKYKSSPNQTQSLNYIEYALLKGLSKNQKLFAVSKINEFKKAGDNNIPYSTIRNLALQS